MVEQEREIKERGRRQDSIRRYRKRDRVQARKSRDFGITFNPDPKITEHNCNDIIPKPKIPNVGKKVEMQVLSQYRRFKTEYHWFKTRPLCTNE